MTPTLPPGRSDHFSRQNLRRISHVTERQLTAWQKVGLLPQRPAYSFSELIALKTIKKLRENRVSLKRIRHSPQQSQECAALKHDPACLRYVRRCRIRCSEGGCEIFMTKRGFHQIFIRALDQAV